MSDRKAQLRDRLHLVKSKIEQAAKEAGRSPEEITLIVVTKTFPVSDAQLLYELGERNFGENRDHEGSAKAPILPNDVRWHFQGQVQSKKIKSIVQWADCIHSLDNLEHAVKFNEYPPRDFFIQISLDAAADHRGGVSLADFPQFFESLAPLENIRTVGLMVVPPLEIDPSSAFTTVARMAAEYGLQSLSMGMSGDFAAAISAGATHIRIGSSILGSREHQA